FTRSTSRRFPKMSSRYLIILAVVLVSACNGPGRQPADGADETVVLVEVDGTPVTLTMLETAMEARGVSEDDHEAMRELLDDLIRMQAVANAARAEGLDHDPDVRARLRIAELQVLNQHYLGQAQQARTISDQDVRDV